MKVIEYPPREMWAKVLKRPAMDTRQLSSIVAAILEDVRLNGDAALREYSRRFDGVELDEFAATEDEFLAAEAAIPAELKQAIAVAKANVAGRSKHHGNSRQVMAQ